MRAELDAQVAATKERKRLHRKKSIEEEKAHIVGLEGQFFDRKDRRRSKIVNKLELMSPVDENKESEGANVEDREEGDEMTGAEHAQNESNWTKARKKSVSDPFNNNNRRLRRASRDHAIGIQSGEQVNMMSKMGHESPPITARSRGSAHAREQLFSSRSIAASSAPSTAGSGAQWFG